VSWLNGCVNVAGAALIGAPLRKHRLTVQQQHHVASGASLRVVPQLAGLNPRAVRTAWPPRCFARLPLTRDGDEGIALEPSRIGHCADRNVRRDRRGQRPSVCTQKTSQTSAQVERLCVAETRRCELVAARPQRLAVGTKSPARSSRSTPCVTRHEYLPVGLPSRTVTACKCTSRLKRPRN
jgi:hypothetical protein